LTAAAGIFLIASVETKRKNLYNGWKAAAAASKYRGCRLLPEMLPVDRCASTGTAPLNSLTESTDSAEDVLVAIGAVLSTRCRPYNSGGDQTDAATRPQATAST